MKLRGLVFLLGIICIALWLAALRPRSATAGGLLLPGAGAVSTARAGAAVASADDGEALVLNPAGLAKAEGTTITLSAAMIEYAMEFQRRGTYDAVMNENYPYAGQPFARVKNDASPPVGIGPFAAVPMIAVVTDLGGRWPGLHLAAGLYAPNGYPFRDLCVEGAGGCQKYVFNENPNIPPPGTRYDIMTQEAAVIVPSLAIAYRVVPQLDVGLRLSAGYARLKATGALWGIPQNFDEDIKKDGILSTDVTDNFVPGFGIGVAYRPTPHLELAANYNSELDVHARGTAKSTLGPSVNLGGVPVTIGPRAIAADILCDSGGTVDALKACGDLAVPRNAQVGARYKFLDAAGRLTGDIELDLDWENWSQGCSDKDFIEGTCASPGNERLTVDADAYVNGTSVVELKSPPIPHGFRDTFGLRLGGSYHIPVGAARDDGSRDELIVQGGLGYDTAAARTGWLRADIDGAARTTIAVGASYRMRRYQISAGGGAILEGSPSNPNVGGGATPCNPTALNMTCNGSTEHQGPDPVSPIVSPNQQALNPVNQGDYKSHYILFILGASTWF